MKPPVVVPVLRVVPIAVEKYEPVPKIPKSMIIDKMASKNGSCPYFPRS